MRYAVGLPTKGRPLAGSVARTRSRHAASESSARSVSGFTIRSHASSVVASASCSACAAAKAQARHRDAHEGVIRQRADISSPTSILASGALASRRGCAIRRREAQPQAWRRKVGAAGHVAQPDGFAHFE